MSLRDPGLQPGAASVTRFLRALRDRWLVVVAVASVCTGGALLVSLRSAKEYQATSKILFQTDALGAVLFGQDAFQGSSDPARAAQTNVDVTTNSAVATAVTRSLGLNESVSGLLDQVSASPENNADIVDISVTDPDPVRAARIANAFAVQFVALRQASDRAKVGQAIANLSAQGTSLPPNDTADRAQLSQELSKLRGLQAVQLGNVSVADSSTPPSAPVSPTPKRDAAVALVLGLILGGGVALLLDAFDERIKDSDEMREAYGLSPIGKVPQSAFNLPTETSRSREAFRMVRNGLEVVAFAERSRVFVVTSAVPAEGKTTLSVNLARVLAMAGRRVVLIDADLRRPAVLRLMDLGSSPGLTDALLGETPASELLVPDTHRAPIGEDGALEPVLPFIRPHSLWDGAQPIVAPRMIIPTGAPELPTLNGTLRVLSSGPVVPDASELLCSEKMDELLAELKGEADFVIVDAPPMLGVPETMSLIRQPSVDGAIVVGRVYHASRMSVHHARDLLRLHHVERAHLVITGVTDQVAYY